MITEPTQKKQRIAARVASSIFRDQKVLAVLLIGSVARGLASNDSDIDLAVLFEEYAGAFASKSEIAGEAVGVERYSVARFLDWPATPLLDQHELRDAGRFANSIVLCSRWKRLSDTIAKCKRALLHPQAAFSLFSTIDANLKKARPNGHVSSADRLWSLQSGCSGLAMLRLSLSPFKFQKPKWTVADLIRSSDKALFESVTSLFSFSDDANSCAAKLELVRSRLIEASSSLGLPPLKRTDMPNDDFDYMRWTFRDAESLLRDSDLHGACYTSVFSLRLMFTIMRTSFSKNPAKVAKCLKWRDESLRLLFPKVLFGARYCEKLWLRMIETGLLIQQQYKDRYRKVC